MVKPAARLTTPDAVYRLRWLRGFRPVLYHRGDIVEGLRLHSAVARAAYAAVCRLTMVSRLGLVSDYAGGLDTPARHLFVLAPEIFRNHGQTVKTAGPSQCDAGRLRVTGAAGSLTMIQ